MKNNYKQRIKDFLGKEGFYIVLFLCICLVAVVSAISYKQSKNDITTNIEAEQSSDNSDDISLNTEEKTKTKELENAEVAKKDSQNNDKSKAANSEIKVSFDKPIEGKLLRGYTYPKPVMIDESNQRTIRGIDIEAKIGTGIKSCEDGIVEKVENFGVEDGMTIIIKHANGIKSKYSNLNENVNVKVNETVKKGTVIGTVGETAKIYGTQKFGEHLNFQILDSNNEQVNPLKYFDYK